MVDIKALRGQIFREYRSIAEFAKAAKLSKHVVYNILNATKLPDSSEISKMGRALSMDADQVTSIFLCYPSPNEQHQSN